MKRLQSLHALALSLIFTLEALLMPLAQAQEEIPARPSLLTQYIAHMDAVKKANPLFNKIMEIVNKIDPTLLSNQDLSIQAATYKAIHTVAEEQFQYILSNIWTHGDAASMDLLSGEIRPEEREKQGEELLLPQARLLAFLLLQNLFYIPEELTEEVESLASLEQASHMMDAIRYQNRMNPPHAFSLYQNTYKTPEEYQQERDEQQRREKEIVEAQAKAVLEEKIRPWHFKEYQSYIEDLVINPQNSENQIWKEVNISGTDKTIYLEFIRDEETDEVMPNLLRYFIDKNREKIYEIAEEIVPLLKGILIKLDSVNSMIFLEGLITRALAGNTHLSREEYEQVKRATCLLDLSPNEPYIWTLFANTCPALNPEDAINLEDDVYRSLSLREAMNNAVQTHHSYAKSLAEIHIVPTEDGSWAFNEHLNLNDIEKSPSKNRIGEAFSYIFSPDSWMQLLDPNRNHDLLIGNYAIKKDGTVRPIEEYRAEIESILQAYAEAKDQYLSKIKNVHEFTSKTWHWLYSSVDYAILYWYDAVGGHPMTAPYDFNPEHTPEIRSLLDTIKMTAKKLEAAGAPLDEIQAILEANKQIIMEVRNIRIVGKMKRDFIVSGIELLATTAVLWAAAPLLPKGVPFLSARILTFAKNTRAFGKISAVAISAGQIIAKSKTIVRLAHLGSKMAAGIGSRLGAGPILAQLLRSTISGASKAGGQTLNILSRLAGIRAYIPGELITEVPKGRLMRLTAMFLRSIRIPQNYVLHLTTNYSLPNGTGLPTMMWNLLVKWPGMISGGIVTVRSLHTTATQGVTNGAKFFFEESSMAMAQVGQGAYGKQTKSLMEVENPLTSIPSLEHGDLTEIPITLNSDPSSATSAFLEELNKQTNPPENTGAIQSVLGNIGTTEFALIASTLALLAAKNTWTQKYLMSCIFGVYMIYGATDLVSQGSTLNVQKRQVKNGLKTIEENYEALPFAESQSMKKYSHLGPLFEKFDKYPTTESKFRRQSNEHNAKRLLLKSEKKRLTEALGQMQENTSLLWVSGIISGVFLAIMGYDTFKIHKATNTPLDPTTYHLIMEKLPTDIAAQLKTKDIRVAMEIFGKRFRQSSGPTKTTGKDISKTDNVKSSIINESMLKDIEKTLGFLPSSDLLKVIEKVVESNPFSYPLIQEGKLVDGKYAYPNAKTVKPGLLKRAANYRALRSASLSDKQIRDLASQGLLFHVPVKQYQDFFERMLTLVPGLELYLFGANSPSRQNPYLTLMVSEMANSKEIEAAYQKQIQFIQGNSSSRSLDKKTLAEIEELNLAYNTLMNPELRALTDKALSLEPNHFIILGVRPEEVIKLSHEEIQKVLNNALKTSTLKVSQNQNPSDPEILAKLEILNKAHKSLYEKSNRNAFIDEYPQYLKTNIKGKETKTAETELKDSNTDITFEQERELNTAFAKRLDQNFLKLITGEKVNPIYQAIFNKNGIADIPSSNPAMPYTFKINPSSSNYFAIFGLEAKAFNQSKNIEEFRPHIESSFKTYEALVTNKLPQLQEADKQLVAQDFLRVAKAKETLLDKEMLRNYQKGLALGDNPITNPLHFSKAINLKGKNFFEIFGVDRNLLNTSEGKQEFLNQLIKTFEHYSSDYDAKYNTFSMTGKELAKKTYEYILKAFTTLMKEELRTQYLDLTNL